MKQINILGLVFGIVLLGLAVVPAAFAQAETENLDPDANACFDGGSLEGQCNTETDWAAGWFLVRYEHGLLNNSSFPSEYKWVLPRDEGNSSHSDDDDDHNDKDSHEDEEICTDPYYEDQVDMHSEA